MADPVRFEAAPLDGHARAVLVGWLSAWFVAVAALLGWSLAGGGLGALAAAVAVGTLLPLLVLARLAGLPSGFVVAGDRLVVQRYLLPARRFTVRGPAALGAGAPGLLVGRGAAWVGAGYGCRWTRARGGAGGTRVYRAVTDPAKAVRLEAAEGTLLLTPAAPQALVRAVRAALRDGRADA